ncbi:MAG: BON domain-containing protein [Candidatus Eiseniibacteriota bacterium]
MLIAITAGIAVCVLRVPRIGAQEVTHAAPPDAIDHRVSAAVEDRLAADAAVPQHRVEVTTRRGVVTLTGVVENLLARDRARRLAETVRGVRAVIDRIEVEPEWVRGDVAIRTDVEEALAVDPATRRYDVIVAVQGGEATLRGTVASGLEKRLAGRVASGVRGVRELSNRLRVQPSGQRDDAEIQTEISEALRWDALIATPDSIDVDVDAGEVTLRGTVTSVMARQRAIGKAWTPGVTAVDASALQVAGLGSASGPRSRAAGAPPPEHPGPRHPGSTRSPHSPRRQGLDRLGDTEIGAAVQTALWLDPRLIASRVVVNVQDGVATLRGDVDNLRAQRVAAVDASNTRGVRSVVNRLRVRPDEPLADGAIEEAVRRALARDPFVSDADIRVRVIAGTVRLGGEVGTYFEKTRAAEAVGRVDGVRGLRNNLVYERLHTPPVFDPYVDETYRRDRAERLPRKTLHGVGAVRSDPEIEEVIKSRISSSALLDIGDIQVTVAHGVARLVGTVDSPAAREAAIRSAFEGGARWVDNDLLVEPVRPSRLPPR